MNSPLSPPLTVGLSVTRYSARGTRLAASAQMIAPRVHPAAGSSTAAARTGAAAAARRARRRLTAGGPLAARALGGTNWPGHRAAGRAVWDDGRVPSGAVSQDDEDLVRRRH